MTDSRDPGLGSRDPGPETRVEVAAGVLQRGDGAVLLAERSAGKILSGYLEFPGGKLESGEPPIRALARELKEELGIRDPCVQPLIQFEHAYPDFRVRVYLFRVTQWRGQVASREGQRLVWAKPAELRRLPLLPANRPALAALELPAALMVTPEPRPGDLTGFIHSFEQALEKALGTGIILRLRAPPLLGELAPALVAAAARHERMLLLLNVGAVMKPPAGFTGLHLPAAVLGGLRARPAVAGWVGASVHNAAEATRARELGLDYVIAGSVRATPSHPARTPLGWSGFERIAVASGIPTYAIGGMTAADVPQARLHWGQGIAAIRAFWPEAA